MSDAREKIADAAEVGIDNVHDMDVTLRGYAAGAAAAIIAELPEIIAGMVEPLEWDDDGRDLRLDDGLIMGKGYDWDGYEFMRQEGYGLGCGYIIWPDHISSNTFSLYGTFDGLYIQSIEGEQAAKDAAEADYGRNTAFLKALGMKEGG